VTLVDLENRRKDPERVKEKVAEALRVHPHRTVDEIFASMPDVVRYTYAFPDAAYVDGYWDVFRHMGGNRAVVGRNLWSRPEYRGVTTWWETPERTLFEVQFHTPASRDARRRTHPLYVRLRDPRTPPREVAALKAELRRIYADVPVPPRIHEIPDFREGGF